MDILSIGKLPLLNSKEGRVIIDTLNSEEYQNSDKLLNKYHVHIFCHDVNHYSWHYNEDVNLPKDINQLGTYHFLTENIVRKTINYAGKNSILSITIKQHNKLLDILRTENYFNKLCSSYKMKNMFVHDTTGLINGFNCNLYDPNNFQIPSLQRIALIYLHKHTCFSRQQTYFHAIADYSLQTYIF